MTQSRFNSDELDAGFAVNPTPDSPKTPSSEGNALHQPRVEHLIDWLTYTVPRDVPLEEALLPHDALYITGEVLPNIKGYNVRLALTHGSISYHTEYPEHKLCIQFTGSDLWNLRKNGVNLNEMLKYGRQVLNANVTRLDYAVDWHADNSPLDLFRAWRDGQLRTEARHCTLDWGCEKSKGELQDAYTVYFGKNKSKRRLRIYDKAAQLNVPGPWVRSELIMRDGFGNQVADAMIREGIAEAGNQAIRDFIECDIDWFNQAIRGPSVYIQTPPPKEHDTDQWFIDILPTFIQRLDEGIETGNYRVFDAYEPVIRRAAPHREAARMSQFAAIRSNN